MRSKRNSYSGRRRIESASTTKRRRERATQKAKQDDQVVEIAHEGISDKQQTTITDTEERGCVWWLGRSCAVIPFMVLAAYQVCVALRIGHNYYDLDAAFYLHTMWQDWRFIVPLVVFTSQAFLGLRGGRYRFWLAFPFIVQIVLIVYLVWTATDFDRPKFWRDWRFIVPVAVFTSQAFLGLKNGWAGCLWNLLKFCLFAPIMVTIMYGAYACCLFLFYGDSFEFQWWSWQSIALIFLTYYWTFLGIFGILDDRSLPDLGRKIKTIIKKKANSNKKE